MGLPNATSILTSLPTGIRAVVSRAGVVASYAVRTAINESGQLSLSGLEKLAQTNAWTIVADFTPRVGVGDVLFVDAVPSFVVDALTSCGNLISRARVVLCEDIVTVGDREINCQLGLLSQDVDMGLGGSSPSDSQGFIVPVSVIPEGVEIVISAPILIYGERFLVEKVSRDAKHDVLCVSCKRRGDA